MKSYCYQVATAEDIAHLYVKINIGMTPGENVTCLVAQSCSTRKVEEWQGYHNNEDEDGKAVFNNKRCESFSHVLKDTFL